MYISGGTSGSDMDPKGSYTWKHGSQSPYFRVIRNGTDEVGKCYIYLVVSHRRSVGNMFPERVVNIV